MAMTGDERIALVLEADDQASNVLARVRGEIEQTNAAARAGASPIVAQAQGLNQVAQATPGLQRTERAMTSIAFAASQARLGTAGAVNAMGTLVDASLSMSAATAAWAPGVAAFVAVLGTAIVLLKRMHDEAAGPSQTVLDRLAKADLTSVTRQMGNLREEYAKIEAKAAQQGGESYLKKLNRATYEGIMPTLEGGKAFLAQERAAANLQAAQKRLGELSIIEAQRLVTQRDETTEQARQKELGLESVVIKRRQLELSLTSLGAAEAEARVQRDTQNAAVRASFRRRDSAGQLIALSAGEARERGRLIGLNEQVYRQNVAIARLKESDRANDARFQANTELAAVRIEAARGDAFAARAEAVRQAYTKTLIANERAGYAPGLKAYLDEVAGAIATAKYTLIEQDRALGNRTARASILASSANGGEVMRGRIEQIEIARDAEIKAGVDVRLATERAERDKRALYYDTYRQAIAVSGQLSNVLIQSKSRELRAIGQSMAAVRRVVLGYEAAAATVQALKYGAKAVGYAADMQWTQAAMAAAAAIQFAGVAATAGAEAAGGGGGGGRAGSSGGGSAGGTSASTFEPRSASQGSGGVTVVLVTRDPYGREQIQQTMYAINRSGKLGVPPIPVPPTPGFMRVA